MDATTRLDNEVMSEAMKSDLKDLWHTLRKAICVPVHPAGWPFIAGAAVLAVLLALLSSCLGLMGLLLAGLVLFFFRNPVRAVPAEEGLIVSPADGVVSAIMEDCRWPDELGLEKATTRISIFLSVFDVHVNRVPLSGTVLEVHHRPGDHANADAPDAAERNERSATLLDIGEGRKLAFVQIAGLVARRIVNDLKTGDTVETGQRMGIIRFGSRTDIYLPEGINPLVAVGQRMVGGETILANLHENGPARRSKAI